MVDWAAPQESDEGRTRADSDPGGGINTDNLMAELQRLWIQQTTEKAEEPHHPLLRSDPFLSASHMTLEDYQINND